MHAPTRCLYAIVEGDDSQRYVQLDTFGSEGRQFTDKVSQSVQFDRHAAKQLLEVIRQTFPGID